MAGTTQPATTLTIGNTGVAVPRLNGVAGLVKVIVRFPTLTAGTATVESSADGSTWLAASGAIALTGYEPSNPTAASFTGAVKCIYGPFLPGTLFRIRHSAATGDIPVYFGL